MPNSQNGIIDLLPVDSTAITGWTTAFTAGAAGGDIDWFPSDYGKYPVEDRNYAIEFYQNGSEIQQSFSTNPGATYSLSFFLQSDNGSDEYAEAEVQSYDGVGKSLTSIGMPCTVARKADRVGGNKRTPLARIGGQRWRNKRTRLALKADTIGGQSGHPVFRP